MKTIVLLLQIDVGRTIIVLNGLKAEGTSHTAG
jgi:hypothetical protein